MNWCQLVTTYWCLCVAYSSQACCMKWCYSLLQNTDTKEIYSHQNYIYTYVHESPEHLRKRKYVISNAIILVLLYTVSSAPHCGIQWVYTFILLSNFTILCVEELHCSTLRMKMVITMVQSLWCFWCSLHTVIRHNIQTS